MFASEPSTNSDSFLISRASRTRVVGSFASRADREARSRSRNSCSARRSPLGSHICTHPYNRCLERRNHSGSNSLSISRKEQLVERETEAQNQADIASARFRANYHRQNDRPYNTKANYGLKHRAWKDWCGDRKFQDLDTVTDGKLLLWLQEIVIPRGNQSAGNKKGLMLSKSGLEGYVKPIIDLYEV